jgi:putative transcriptional regulator
MRVLVASAIFVLGSTAFLTGTAARQARTNSRLTRSSRHAASFSETDSGTPQSQLLVASRNLPDPFFKKSVVLMLPFKEGPLLVGLIINKPSKIKVRDLFPDSPELQKLDTMAYFGGPVDAEVGVRSAIFRSKTPPSKATLVFGDVYVSFDPDAIVALAQNPQQAATLRVFVGRAQWAPEQFEAEAAAGAWHSVRGGADSIFTTLPETLWQRLINQAEPRSLVRYAPGLLVPAAPVAVSSSSKKGRADQDQAKNYQPGWKNNGRRPCQMNCVSVSKSAAI